jgi:hypothetical protein
LSEYNFDSDFRATIRDTIKGTVYEHSKKVLTPFSLIDILSCGSAAAMLWNYQEVHGTDNLGQLLLRCARLENIIFELAKTSERPDVVDMMREGLSNNDGLKPNETMAAFTDRYMDRLVHPTQSLWKAYTDRVLTA